MFMARSFPWAGRHKRWSPTIPGLRALTAESPDGRTWDVAIRTFRLPALADSEFDPLEHAHDLIDGLFIFLVLVPFFWIVIPLARAVALLPIAFVRPIFSPKRWVVAESRWPGSIEIIWEAHKDDVAAVAHDVTDQLGRGYEHLSPPNARRVSMTEPPGLADLDA